ncbi:MAG: response regulator [Desulfatiglans sp.]|jgi:signal transduction histidine kinase/CheY-like chemotaxis protein|nr:response regulator [Desulfatiglans sp.]
MDLKPTREELEQKIKELEKLLNNQEEKERKLLEEISGLKQTEKYYNALMQNTDDFIVICDQSAIPQAFNERYKEIGKALLNTEIKPGMQPHKMSGNLEVIKYWTSLQGRALNGEKFLAEFFDKERNQYLETLFCPIREGEKVTGFTEITRNITARRQAEIKQKELQSKFSNALEIAHLGPWEYDPASDLFTFNDYFYKIFRTTAEEVGGYVMTSGEYNRRFIHPDDIAFLTEEGRKASETNDPNYNRQFEQRIIYADGNVGYIAVRFFIQKDENGRTIRAYGVNQDITETVRLREKLAQVQKLEAIGTLAGGLAHDYNNILMGILGNTALMLLEMDTAHPHYAKLKNIEQYVQNASDLTKQMLGFARGGKYEVKPTDMNELVKKSSDMFGQTKKEITIHTKWQEDIWTVEIDQGQMNQVLLNLYVNAWQSMPHGGELYLETKNIVLDDNYVKPFYVAPGNYVKISVTDTGIGMDAATQKRIFDPFFTTKKMGRGTGLGLATVYGIIKNHSGIINVYSEKGEGSTFNIYLPVSSAVLTKEKEPSFHVLKGNETILLVDDEEMIINIGTQLLERLGYRVLCAKTGSEALETYKNNRGNIDLVILDMIMPNMGGGAVYDELKKVYPGVKVLLSSGYSLNGQATSILKRGCNGFIQKPFGLDELSKRIREILGSE